MMRRFRRLPRWRGFPTVCALAALLAGALAVGPVLPAAADDWCDIDPGTPVTTPGGQMVVVHLTDYGPAHHRGALAHPKIAYVAVPSGAGTQVELDVTVSDGGDGHQHPVATQAWTSPGRQGTLLAGAQGVTAQPMRLSFWLDVP